MFWEIIATVLAGVLLAGLVMPLRLIYKKMPKWLVPFFAGVGMMLFQIYSEYTWFDTAQAKLPKDSVVVGHVAKASWFRPWSYVYPQTFWFVVLDKKSIQRADEQTHQATLYFIERHRPIYPLNIRLDCQSPSLEMDKAMQQKIITAVCHGG